MIDIEKLQSTSGIIGSSDGIRQVFEMIAQVAPVDITVLIAGESGTGKEMVAQAIHKFSRRAQNEMVTVNCGAIPVGIIESELFGHKKGAFTGATESRKGYFEAADKGTIFLDEIGELPLEIQAKLLRVIEQKEFMRVGDTKSEKIDTRTRINSFCSMTLSSFAWISSGSSPISSKNMVPLSAASKYPFLDSVAPVKAPFL
jgi:transcriptional regulator with GAF, ATPase, and Fis domain